MSKFCSNCGKELPENANACPNCGTAVKSEATAQTAATATQPTGAPIIVNVESNNVNTNAAAPVVNPGRQKNKWIALLFLWFFGIFGGHKFYEGKIGMGILYLFTGGLFTIGVFVDFWILLFKPTHYYV